MSRLGPFRAGFYADPTSDSTEGVLDVSGALSPPSTVRGDSWPPDAITQPSEWARASREGVVEIDSEPALYVIRAGWRDEDGRPWQRSGVIGRSGEPVSLLSQPATVVVSSAAFSDLLVPEGVPLLRATVSNGVHYRVWPLRRAGVMTTIADAVEKLAPASTSPFILATADFFTVPSGLLFCAPESITFPS